jgi:adenine deaminase
VFASIAPKSLSATLALLWMAPWKRRGLRGSSRRLHSSLCPQTAACSHMIQMQQWSILHRMTQEKTERSNCRFMIRDTKDGKPQILVERYHQTISVLSNVVLGFDLLGGTTLEQAKKVVAVLNENVLDVFVTLKQTDAVPGT